jgi:hypothetical protein
VTGGDGSNTATLSPNTVNVGTEMSFVYRPDATVAQDSKMIIKFPAKYTLPISGITCFINYNTSAPCYPYPDAGWIVITAIPTELSQATEYNFIIKGLFNPKNRLDPRAPIEIVTVGGSDSKELEYVYFNDLADLELGAVSPATVTSNYYEALRTNMTYTWVFMLANNIEQGGKIVLTFPSGNYVLTTLPAPTCSIAGTLFKINTSTDISCVFTANQVTISNFAAYEKGGFITVNIYHVLNPA